MSARQVHAVMAAALSNPQLIERWRQDPESLREHGLAPEELDLNALWKFAGLAVKIRHNGLRGELPWTFRLLGVLGLEAEVFASYGSFLAKEGIALGQSVDARARDLSVFLERWLDCGKPDHSLVWDLLRHELALMQLSNATEPDPSIRATAPDKEERPRASTVPQVCGSIVLHAMQCDPRIVIDRLRHATPPLHTVPREDSHICYWRPSAASDLRIIRLDALGYYLLSHSDGSASAGDLSRRLVGGRRVAPALLGALAELRAAGLLFFRAPQRKEPG